MTKNVLAVVAPHVGGRAGGAGLARLLPAEAHVTVMEAVDEDPAALRAPHVIITALAPVTAQHVAAAEALELVQCASHGFDYVDVAAVRARGARACCESGLVARRAAARRSVRALGVPPGSPRT
ncbi:phosphoglycerate dehydrogenase, partial [Streptomyces sp. NPDC020489]